jgi:UDP-3-O-[3-hydroxymyristoyl] glucosamine N-acyltransferase
LRLCAVFPINKAEIKKALRIMNFKNVIIHPTAIIEAGAQIGAGSKI